jgi:hypothetical protein
LEEALLAEVALGWEEVLQVEVLLVVEVPLVEVALDSEVVLGVEVHRIHWLSTKSERTCPGQRLERYRC